MSGIIVATKGGLEPSGVTTIYLHFFAKIKEGHKYTGSITARSGLAGLQNFRTKAQQRKGKYEPCPEGHFKIGIREGQFFGLEWKGKKGDYNDRFGSVASAVWVEIDEDRHTGFHEDYMPGTPGTAGCIGMLLPELKKFVNQWNGYGPFTDFYAIWGLGLKLPSLPGLVIPKTFKML